MKMYIDELRQQRGLTWDALSEATGISKGSIYSLAHGRAKSIRLEHLDALCTFFGLASFDKLMEPQIIALPLRPDPVLQERAKKAAAARKTGAGDDR